MPDKKVLIIPSNNYHFPLLTKLFKPIYTPISQEEPFNKIVNDTISHLQKNNISPAGVIGVTNDRSAVVAALLAKKYNLLGPSIESIYAIQEKAVFSKRMQKARLPIPRTVVFNIFKTKKAPLPFPIFIKPIRGTLSTNAYHVSSEEEFHHVLEKLRNLARKKDNAYEVFFSSFKDAKSDYTQWYIAQPYILAKQYTADAIVTNGKVHLIGIIQTIYFNNRKSFKRFDLPGDFPYSKWPEVERLLQKIVQATELNNTAFSLEFFYTKDKKIQIIECNTRISLQFIPLYEQYLTESPILLTAKAATGEAIAISRKKSSHRLHASSFALRLFTDRIITYKPHKKELEAFRRTYHLLGITFFGTKGKKLSELDQDAYSFRYGIMDVAGKNLQEIQQTFERAKKHLPLTLKHIPRGT